MHDPRQNAQHILDQNAITLERLWITYWGEGGIASILELDAYVHEALRPHPFELDLIFWAIEELQHP
ncbi:hypothetical protein J2Y41_000958 [Arthrobacter sp. 1088]|uniref:hypothetical protein n=1 Tax=Arthrobacter sp. 1088 TaxID=2817768 RepID=UPI0028600362|nr:hypothetical protein [Arthrobacter sp. 1088]MDR6685405.1 hypothetical protein [Arthrobacter sp. 1088]